jgi:serine/threonine protein kinase
MPRPEVADNYNSGGPSKPRAFTTDVIEPTSSHEETKVAEVAHQRRTTEIVTIEDFQILSLLGKGSCGKVVLAKYKRTGETVAIKSVRKDVMLENELVEYTKTEKRIMENVDNPFLCKLMYAFSTAQKVYFVTKYMGGGELFLHLSHAGKFEEERARFYGAQIAIGLSCLHDRHYIYRDLKPENLLIDEEGNI